MSTAYGIPPPLSSRPQFEHRKISGNMTAGYERPLNTSNRQRTPSPGPSRRAYDSYVPHRSENTPYRSVYRPNIYRPDPSSYHPRSPSPDARSPDSNYRGSSWRPSDRRQFPPSPTSRRFEPSDVWRHGHGDRSSRDFPPYPDRHYRGKSSMDLSPERSQRYERLPIGTHAPSYFKRDPWPVERRTVADTYRPHYDDERPYLSRRDLPSSPANGPSRRESESSLPSRLADPEPTRFPMKPSLSGGTLASPAPNPHISPWSSPDALKQLSVLRSASRSSIASTHVSDRKSPGASIPQPLQARLPVGLPPKPLAAIDALTKETRRVDARYGVKPVHNGVISQTPVEPENDLKPSSSENDISQNGVTVSKPEAQASEDEPLGTVSAVIDVNDRMVIDGEVPLPRPEPQETPTTQTEALRSPVLRDVSPASVVGSELSKPDSVIEPGVKDTNTSALEIPPTTHSPAGVPDLSREREPGQADLPVQARPSPEDIPSLSSARTMTEALRITVMTRLLRDHQSREARINPILRANQAIAPPLEVHPTSTPGSLIDKMCTGLAHDTRLVDASKTRPLLVKYFAHRHAVIEEKKVGLREDYMNLQDRWLAHCNILNEHQKTLASEQENQPPVRTTRRSMAITDAVRSDFEMEQVLASLGNDDATDPNHLSIRNLARIPEMISTINGKVDAVFDDMNDLVENPAEYYAPDTGITDWTDDEKKVFMEKFGAYPKQFGVIAEFLPNKSAAQCVTYYYLHKKLFIDFRRVISQYAPNKRRRRGMGRKKGNGLLADIVMHDLEVHRGSGSASPSTAIPARPSRGRRSLNAMNTAKPPSRRNPVQLEETPTTTPEPETKRKRRAPSGTSTPVPTNPTPMPLMASTPLRMPISEHQSTSFLPLLPTTPLEVPAGLEEDDALEQEAPPTKRPRRTRKIKSAMIVLDDPVSPPLQTAETTEPDYRDATRKERADFSILLWSEEEEKRFLSLFSQYGTDFKQIAALMPPKTIGQVTAYYNAVASDLALRLPLSPDNQEPHWSTFPASETRQISSPPRSSPATLMTTIKPPTPGGYDSARNSYPQSSSSSRPSYGNHTNFSGDIQSSSRGATLPSHPGPSNAPPPLKVMVSAAPETLRTINPFNTPRRSNISQQYSYPSLNPPLSELSQGYTSSMGKGKYPEDHPPLPSRQSLPNPHVSPSDLSLRAPQDYRHPRARIATPSYSASSSHPAAGLSGLAHAAPSPSLSGPAAGATIIHSPILRSPQLPLHRSPPPYKAYPHPSRIASTPSVNPREHTPQIVHPHFQGQPSSSLTNRTSSPNTKDRHYHNAANFPYDDRRSASVPGVTAVDSRVDGERRRETYPDFHRSSSNDDRHYSGRGWHPPSSNAMHSSSSAWTTEPHPQAGWRG